ncbi:hypothetical protein [Antarcticimicrobium luteum]|uniref:Uncharacterized protein n=1 Tax=Antarcticimicrobium luteum TaxID=2547397 RepID=A0A4R5VF90_9RHOB|nr:hypothetical protein [Antarcticimicrobium luteum]TDK51171.1 hypothetical protein E1832_04170 [Antarcticimicrobium luteum]
MSAETRDTLADELARDTLAAMEEIGDDRLYTEVAKALGASSQSLEEAFLTSVRVRLAERNGRRFLESHLAAARAGKKPTV